MALPISRGVTKWQVVAGLGLAWSMPACEPGSQPRSAGDPPVRVEGPPVRVVEGPPSSIDDAPARVHSPLGTGALETGIYAVRAAWTSSGCDGGGLVDATGRVATHVFVTEAPGAAGARTFSIASASDLASSRTGYRAALEGRGVEVAAFRLYLTEVDERGRLRGELSGGHYEGEVCTGIYVIWGYLERERGGPLRLVIRERSAPRASAGPECSAIDEPARDSGAACTLLVADIARVEAGPRVDCADRLECRLGGTCSPRAGRADECEASSDAVCDRSSDCQLRGACSLRDGRCVVGSDADCAGSLYCREGGLCHAAASSHPGEGLACAAHAPRP